ncbi:hypothetical protein BGZ46_002728 [Entomortierella lignicola]|nr:hypothetical protein BGZ46_002728 [Entomortierella lignicola]
MVNTPTSGVSSGAYKPGYKPPPIPLNSSSPSSPSFNNNNSNTTNVPVSPGRPSTASPRPALPFLEKYAKKNKSASSSPPAVNGSSQSNNNINSNNNSNNNLSGSPLSVSPTTPTAPSYDRQVLSNGTNGHYQREQNDYFPKTPVEDRFASQQPPSRSRTPMEDGRYGSSSPVPTRSKTPVMDPTSQFGTSPNSMRASQQPALPQKSNARSPSIASAQGLGIQGMDSNGRIKSPTLGYSDSNGRDRERERGGEPRGSRQQSDYSSSPPSVSNGFGRSGSSGSAASSVLTERAYQRERSNTVLSERSERSVRSARSDRGERSDRPDERSERERSRYTEQEDRERERERERDRDKDARPEDVLSVPNQLPSEFTSPSPTRGRAPPVRKPSGDQFDAMMDNLIQEFNVTSTRDSSRPASSHRSRSRPNLPESGRSGSPPPTPGLPKGGDSDSIRSHRSGRERSEKSDRDRDQRSERGERSDRSDRDREHRSDRERSDRDRERSDKDRERERGQRSERSERGDRERESERGGEDRDRERARDRERSGTSGRSSTRSRSTNRRGAAQHCEACKHDIQPHEATDAIKMPRGDYHAECFKCARCRRPLESPRHGFEYEGRLLCEKDYQRYMERDAQRSERTDRSDRPSRSRNAVCAGCENPIQGETPVYALGQSWHEHHLTCHHCKKPIQQSVGHVEKNGRVYCPKDFGELFLPKCRACNLPVEKEAVCAQDGKLQGKWHAACFGCQTCRKPFPDKSFYVFGDAPYCRRHYHKLNNSLCKGCDQPIEGPCAQTMEGWRFHPQCFSCVECKTPLTDIYYNFENQAYCEKDIMVIQRTRNVRAERRKTFFGKV